MSVTKVAITGATGRMGQTLLSLAGRSAAFKVSGSVTRDSSAAAVEALFSTAVTDVVVDFSSPEASTHYAEVCARNNVPLVVGTTGFGAEALARVRAHGARLPMVVAPNMSVGVNVMLELAAELARRLGDDFDIDIVEAHHRHKKDAPSGTALRLADELVKATGRSPADVRTSRVGAIGERARREIGVQTLRGGDVVGEHTVFFFGEGERLELTHRASSREQFAKGALRAAAWLVGRAPGVYDMSHVLSR